LVAKNALIVFLEETKPLSRKTGGFLFMDAFIDAIYLEVVFN